MFQNHSHIHANPAGLKDKFCHFLKSKVSDDCKVNVYTNPKETFFVSFRKNLWQKFNPKARDRGETNDVVNDGTSWPSHTN